MTIELIIAIIVLSLVLINVELFVIPGTTVFGIVGAIGLIIGIALAYNFGTYTGNVVLGSSMLCLILSFVLFMRMLRTRKIAVQKEITGKVNEIEKEVSVVIGDEGETISVLRPNGKVLVKDQKFEAYSFGNYIEKGMKIKIARIDSDKIFVEPLNT